MALPDVIDLTGSDEESERQSVQPRRFHHPSSAQNVPRQISRHDMTIHLQHNFVSPASSITPRPVPTSTAPAQRAIYTAPVSPNVHPRSRKPNKPFDSRYLNSSPDNQTKPGWSASPIQPLERATNDVTQKLGLPRRICVQCSLDTRVTCDGCLPCSACSEPGLECEYEGEPTGSRVAERNPQLQSLPAKTTPGGISLRRGSNFGSTKTLTRRAFPNISMRDGLVHNTPAPLITEHKQKEELVLEDVKSALSFDDASDSDDAVPLALDNLEAVRQLLQKHEARMKLHQEYRLQPLLQRAKREAAAFTGPEISRSESNPFANLIEASIQKRSDLASASSVSFQKKSYKSGVSKKWTTNLAPLSILRTSPVILPKYKSIGRLGSSLLAPNSRIQKYLPYFPDVEEFPDVEQKLVQEFEEWYHVDEDRMRDQRKCLELSQLWKPWVENFVSDLGIQFKDILWYLLHHLKLMWCHQCDTRIGGTVSTRLLSSGLIVEPDKRSLNRAALAVEAMDSIVKISMWHILVDTNLVKQILKTTVESSPTGETLCSICFLYNCISHGAYFEPEDSVSGAAVFNGGRRQSHSDVLINDDEHEFNERLPAVTISKSKDYTHQCGLYCVDVETSVKAILGRRQDGCNDGVYNHATRVTRPTFNNDVPCSAECFWMVEKRSRFSRVSHTKLFEPNISTQNKDLFKRLLRLFSSNQRVPCMISTDIKELSCIDAFYYILAVTQNPSHIALSGSESQQQATRKMSKVAQGLDTSLSADLDERPPFLPCSHEGPCQNNPDCSCSFNKVHCERFCGCDEKCKRRFIGCSCAVQGKGCFNDNRCECWALNRECDPWLCTTCGALEVLDPANKYNEEIRRGRCKNTKIQLELPARTIKAPSEVQGWGLYAGEDLEVHSFIGEYKGERVGNQESDRRGSVYHHLGQEYLFMVNKEQEIDGSNFGNKMRFINNSQRPEFINVMAKNLLCNGVQRVMLYAKAPVKAGDELLYKYNYPDSVTKRFWERGEGPAQGQGAVVAKPNFSLEGGRLAKVAGKTNEATSTTLRSNLKQSVPQSETSRSHMPDRRPNGRFIKGSTGRDGDESSIRRESKRKRVAEGEALSAADAVDHRGTERAYDESNGSEFEDGSAGGEEEEGSEEDSEASGTSSDNDTPAAAVRQRRIIRSNDGRLGGRAQKKAWRTRKNKARE